MQEQALTKEFLEALYKKVTGKVIKVTSAEMPAAEEGLRRLFRGEAIAPASGNGELFTSNLEDAIKYMDAQGSKTRVSAVDVPEEKFMKSSRSGRQDSGRQPLDAEILGDTNMGLGKGNRRLATTEKRLDSTHFLPGAVAKGKQQILPGAIAGSVITADNGQKIDLSQMDLLDEQGQAVEIPSAPPLDRMNTVHAQTGQPQGGMNREQLIDMGAQAGSLLGLGQGGERQWKAPGFQGGGATEAVNVSDEPLMPMGVGKPSAEEVLRKLMKRGRLLTEGSGTRFEMPAIPSSENGISVTNAAKGAPHREPATGRMGKTYTSNSVIPGDKLKSAAADLADPAAMEEAYSKASAERMARMFDRREHGYRGVASDRRIK